MKPGPDPCSLSGGESWAVMHGPGYRSGESMNRLECGRMFIAVMEAGSFIGRAQLLGTSSDQASKLVSRLEADLAVRLLNRTTRSICRLPGAQ